MAAAICRSWGKNGSSVTSLSQAADVVGSPATFAILTLTVDTAISDVTATIGGTSGTRVVNGTNQGGIYQYVFYAAGSWTSTQTASCSWTTTATNAQYVISWFTDVAGGIGTPVTGQGTGTTAFGTGVTLGANDIASGWVSYTLDWSNLPTTTGTESYSDDINNLAGTGSSYNTGTGSISVVWDPTSSCDWIYWTVPVYQAASGPTGVKTFDGVTQSTGIKTYLGNTVATTKSVNGIT